MIYACRNQNVIGRQMDDYDYEEVESVWIYIKCFDQVKKTTSTSEITKNHCMKK
jgi:hypothetical protein